MDPFSAPGQSLQPEVLNKIQEWLGAEGGTDKLSDWDISRDAPYFGFPIPDEPGNYFYVWIDAPIGYLAARSAPARNSASTSSNSCRTRHVDQYHFIGKDIIYFHTLFWPAMLKFAGAPYRTPTNVFVHGFLTALGEKMSKSRGTGISPTLPRPGPQLGMAALLHRGQAERQGRRHRLQSRRLRRPGEQRSGRQVREHRQRAAALRRGQFDGIRLSPGVVRRAPPACAGPVPRRSARLRTAGIRAKRCARPWRSPTRRISISTGEALGAGEGPCASARNCSAS